MKLKIEDILNADIGLAEIARAKMPAGTGIRLARAIKVVSGEARTAAEALNALLVEHGTPQAGQPGVYSIAPESREAYAAAVKEIRETEVELAFEVVELAPALEVPPAALVAAGPFVRVREE